MKATTIMEAANKVPIFGPLGYTSLSNLILFLVTLRAPMIINNFVLYGGAHQITPHPTDIVLSDGSKVSAVIGSEETFDHPRPAGRG